MTQTAPSETASADARCLASVHRIYGELRFHTDADVLALAYPSADTLWSVEDPGLLRRWDAATGRRLGEAFLSDVETLWVFSSDARLLASASDELCLWDVPAGRLLQSRPQPSWVTAIAFAPHGQLLATGHDDGKVRLWVSDQKEPIQVLNGHSLTISAIAFNSDGTRLACAGEDRLISLWDAANGRQVGQLVGHTDRIHALAWQPGGNLLVSAGWDTTARVWNVDKCEPVILLNGHANQVVALAFSPNGKALASADSADALYLWDPVAGKIQHVFSDHENEIHCLAFSPDGTRLVSGGADRRIRVHDTQQQAPAAAGGVSPLAVSNLALSPDGARFFSSCMGAGIQAWLTADGAPVPALEGPSAERCLVLSADGRWLAGGGADKRIHLWDATTGKLVRSLEGQRGRVASLAFGPDSQTLASGSNSDGLVWLWNAVRGEPILVIPEAADTCMISALGFHPEGRMLAVGGIDWLATGGSDGALCLWDLVERELITDFGSGGILSLAFHPAGRWLAAGTLAGSVVLWDVQTITQPPIELAGPDDIVTCLAYSPDGHWLAAGSDDRTLRLWNTETNALQRTHRLDTQLKALLFSPDGRFLFTGNGNTTSYQFEVQRLVRDP